MYDISNIRVVYANSRYIKHSEKHSSFSTWFDHGYSKQSDEPDLTPPQPYLLSVFVTGAVFLDFLAWFARDYVLICWKTNNISSSSTNNRLLSIDSIDGEIKKK